MNTIKVKLCDEIINYHLISKIILHLFQTPNLLSFLSTKESGRRRKQRYTDKTVRAKGTFFAQVSNLNGAGTYHFLCCVERTPTSMLCPCIILGLPVQKGFVNSGDHRHFNTFLMEI